jgi:hypothetical protein
MANSTVNIPTLPSVSTSVDPEVRRSLDILRSWFESVRASGGFGSTTVSQTVVQGGGGGGGGGTSILNPPAPSAITGLTATGAYSAIILNWNDPSYSAYGYTQVWRSTVNNVGTAIYVGESSSSTYCDIPPNSDASVTYYYWVRLVSYTGITGAWNATNGTSAHTAVNPGYALENLANQTTPVNLGSNLLIAGNINGVPTIGIAGGLIVDGTILGRTITAQTITGDKLAAANLITAAAQIQDAVITNAKIAAIDAGKITTGYLSADRIQSGSFDGKITTIMGDQIHSGVITSDHIVSDAVTIKNVVSKDYVTDGGETSADILTIEDIDINIGASLMVNVDVEGCKPGDTIQLKRSFGGVNSVLKKVVGVSNESNIPTNFNFSLTDQISSTLTPPVLFYDRSSWLYKCSYDYKIQGGGSSQGAGQSFYTSTGAFTIGAVSFTISKVGSPVDNLVIQIYDALNGGNLKASGTFAMASLPTRKTFTQLVLQTPGALNGDTLYYCRLTRSGGLDTSNYAKVWGFSSNLEGYSTARLVNNSGTWSVGGGGVDVRFAAYATLSGDETWTYTLTATPTDGYRADPGHFDDSEILIPTMSVVQLLR